MRKRSIAAAVLCVLLALKAGAGSVDPLAWAKRDLVEEAAGTLRYDQYTRCALRGGEDSTQTALVHIMATAPVGAISRDQLVARVAHLEAAYLLGIGEGWLPGASAMELVQVLDCRPRKTPEAEPTRLLNVTVTTAGFEATMTDRDSGETIRHAETWPEAFRP